MTIRALAIIALSLIAGCSAPDAPQPRPAAPQPTVTAGAPPAARTARPSVWTDALLPGPGRTSGTALAGLPLPGGSATWSANAGVALAADGATASTTGGAHHAIPVVAGTIRIQAEVRAQGSGFTGIALGRGDLSSSFWDHGDLLLFVTAGGYGLRAGRQNLIPHGDAKLLRADGVNQVELQVDTIARTVTARLNGTTVLAGAVLPAEVRTDALGAAGFRFNEPVVAGVPRVGDWRAEVASAATTGLVPVDLAMCFVEPGKAATLRWTCSARGPGDRVPYIISDYAGRRIDAGSAQMTGDGSVALDRTFARGWYEIAFPEARQTFGIVALEAQAGPADPFFCMDSALSWLETDPARRDALVRILARTGIALSRERMGLGAVNPRQGVWTWNQAPRSFDAMRATYATHRVGLLEMLHGGGAAHGMDKASPFAQDLAAFATSWVAVAQRWQPGWGAAEADNEPDLRSVPADHYAPSVKAMSYALAQAGCTVPLVTGVFGTMPPGSYFDACTANGLLVDSDAVSLHSYDPAPAIEGMIARYRAWLAAAGVETMPLWHSECGWSWVNGPARPPCDQDALSAAEIAAKAVESLACGVARHFPFVYVYYEEGHKNFGMMGREATPLRSMAAYAMAVQALSGRRYLGDLQGLGPAVKLARVFGDGGAGRVAALYTGSLDPVAVRLPAPALRAAGADGRDLPIADGAITLVDGLAYVWFDAAACAAQVKADTAAARLHALGRQPMARPRLASPIVLQFRSAALPARVSARRYLVTQETARALPVQVRIHNLSQAEIGVQPALALPGGTASAAAPAQVPAMGWTDVAWTLDASAALDIAQTRMLTITATAAGTAPPSPLAIPLVMDGTLEQHLARNPRQRSLPFTELGRWTANLAGHGSSRFSVADGVWRLDETFTGAVGNWDYPKFALPGPIDPGRESGFLIRARIHKPAGMVAIMANPNQPDSFWSPDIFPADGQWHVVHIPFAEFKPGPNGAGMQNTRLDPASWRVLAIGMGSRGEENTLEISHFLVVGGGE